jgi:hypothetical protein
MNSLSISFQEYIFIQHKPMKTSGKKEGVNKGLERGKPHQQFRASVFGNTCVF